MEFVFLNQTLQLEEGLDDKINEEELDDMEDDYQYYQDKLDSLLSGHNLSAYDLMQAKIEMIRQLKTRMRLKRKGFVFHKELGFILPGID